MAFDRHILRAKVLEPPTDCHALFGGKVHIRAFSQPAAELYTPPQPEDIIAIHCSGSARVERELMRRRQSASMQRGAVTIVPAMTASSWRLHGPCTFLHFAFEHDWLRSFARERGWRGETALQPIFAHRDPELDALAFSIWAQVQRPRELSSTAVELGVQMLLLIALQAYADRDPQPVEASMSAAVRDTLKHIEAHLDSPLNLSDLADRAGVSPFALSKAVKRHVGQSPIAYLTERRMERAKVLLKTTRLPIAQIAQLSGYGSQQHFATAFRRTTGFSPRAYRGS